MIHAAILALAQTAAAASSQPSPTQPELMTESAIETAARSEVRLKVGTTIRLELIDELSTKRTAKGETFELRVIEDVRSDGLLVIPEGTKAIGEVTRSDAKGAFGKSGKLEAHVLYLELDGRAVRLSGALGVAGQGGTTETVLTAIAAGALAFAVTGKSAVLPAGTELIAQTDRPATFHTSPTN